MTKIFKSFLASLIISYRLLMPKIVYGQGNALPEFAIPENTLDQWSITNLGEFVGAILTILFLLSGILTFVYLIWGGLEWIISGGDKSKTQAARDRITAAFVGLAIVAISYALIRFAQAFFGIDITTTNIRAPWN